MKYHIRIDYTDSTTKNFSFETYKEALSFVANEGDHVLDWKLRKI